MDDRLRHPDTGEIIDNRHPEALRARVGRLEEEMEELVQNVADLQNRVSRVDHEPLVYYPARVVPARDTEPYEEA